MKIPTEITWNGLKRIRTLKDLGYQWHRIKEVRIGRKAFRLVGVEEIGEDPVLRFEKMAGGYSHDVVVSFTDNRPERGVSRRHLTLYLTQEESETLGQWLLDGRYSPPQSNREHT